MKVFNLGCAQEHRFEGWFASEDDFASQKERGLLECPLCGERAVHKLPSAPRLNLGAAQATAPPAAGAAGPAGPAPHDESLSTMQGLWLQAVRHVMANTEDVGPQFVEEARRIHYGEAQERPIRGQASADERRELREEGIEVVPLPVPKALSGPVQ